MDVHDVDVGQGGLDLGGVELVVRPAGRQDLVLLGDLLVRDTHNIGLSAL